MNKIKIFIRYIKRKLFQLRYGFDYSDCWSLDCSLAVWLYPRLVHFRNNLNSHPSEMTYEEWEEN